MFGQSLLSAFGIACTTDTDQLFQIPTTTSAATYQFNNATTSIPNNTYPGTANNITYTAGQFGNAAVFNGSNSYITTNYNINFSNTPWTVSFWMKADIANDRYVLGTDGMSISARGVGSVFLISGGNTAITYSTGVWKHFVYTFDGSGTSKGYGNGILEDTKSSSISSNSNPITFGRYGSNNAGYFDGTIDQVRIFNSELPQAAITVLYNETTTTAQSASIDYPSNNPNSVAYYKMSDATDQLGNYNGTATNVNFNTEGKFGFAGAFNGSSSKIVLPTTTLDSIKSNGSFGVSAWFKTSETGDRKCIFSAFESSYLMLEVTSGNQLKGIVSNTSGTNTELTVPITVTDGNWHHAVFTGNNGSLSLYLDNGTPQTSSSWNGTFFSGTGGTGIGIRMASSDHWDGDIDQIRLYDSVLSASNVSTLYKEVECEPAAINALDQFNTVLYTGNNSTQSITGVGFQPDFVWFKNRTGTNSNALVDSVRGRGSYLFSDDNYAASTGGSDSNDVTSFDSNGFSLGSVSQAGSTNTSGGSIVAWNWKAPLANLSSSFNGSSSYISLPAGINKNNNFSWSFWYMFNTHTYYDTPIGFFMNGYTNFIDTPSSGELSFYDGNSRLTTPSSTFTAGTWYHVVVTKSSTAGRKFYVNGSVVATDSGNSNSGSSSGGRNLLGAYSSSGNPTSIALEFDGKLAQVRIFDDALTAGEVSDLYTEPAASNNTLNYPAGAGCIAAYPLQTNAVDLSGNYSGASSNVTFGQPGYLTGNTDGTIPSTVAANVEAGFSVVQWTSPSGNGNPSNVGHGLNSAPELIFYKGINYADNWYVYSQPTGLNKYLNLNTNGSVTTNNSNGFTNVNSSTFTTNLVNGSYNILSYCFTSIPGYSKIGSYTSTYPSTTSVYVGFQPRFVMIKSYNQTRNWVIHDSARGADEQLYANLNNAEGNTGTDFQFTSTGFNVSGGGNDLDGGPSYSYIYLAIA